MRNVEDVGVLQRRGGGRAFYKHRRRGQDDATHKGPLPELVGQWKEVSIRRIKFLRFNLGKTPYNH